MANDSVQFEQHPIFGNNTNPEINWDIPSLFADGNPATQASLRRISSNNDDFALVADASQRSSVTDTVLKNATTFDEFRRQNLEAQSAQDLSYPVEQAARAIAADLDSEGINFMDELVKNHLRFTPADLVQQRLDTLEAKVNAESKKYRLDLTYMSDYDRVQAFVSTRDGSNGGALITFPRGNGDSRKER